MRIVIVGAGVAGSIMARALSLQSALEVTCLEQAGPTDPPGPGAGLVIAPNAIQALHRRDPLQASAIGEAGMPWDRWRASLCSGELLADLPLTRVADHGGVRILRAALYGVLRRAAGRSTHYGCRVLACGACGHDPTRSYVVWERDGQRHRLDDIDLLIGADGRDSPTRRAFAGPPGMYQHGVSLFRLLVPDSGAARIDDYEQWCNGANRLLAFRLPEGVISIAGTLPLPPGGHPARPPGIADTLRAAYLPPRARAAAPVAWLLDTLCADTAAIHWCSGQAGSIRFAEPRGQVMYLGDSAHAMPPNLDHGASQAIEDACCAADVVDQALASGERDPRAWLARFEADRRARLRTVLSVAPDAAAPMPAPGQDPGPLLEALRRLYCPGAAGALPPA